MESQSFRIQKIEETYFHAFSHLLITQIEEPRLNGVRLTRVTITPDLSLARIYFAVDGGPERVAEVMKGFRRCKGFLRQQMATAVQMRRTPQLEFFYDETDDLLRRVEGAFKELDKEKS